MGTLREQSKEPQTPRPGGVSGDPLSRDREPPDLSPSAPDVESLGCHRWGTCPLALPGSKEAVPLLPSLLEHPEEVSRNSRFSTNPEFRNNAKMSTCPSKTSCRIRNQENLKMNEKRQEVSTQRWERWRDRPTKRSKQPPQNASLSDYRYALKGKNKKSQQRNRR